MMISECGALGLAHLMPFVGSAALSWCVCLACKLQVTYVQDVQRLSREPGLVSVFTDTSVGRVEDAANTHVFNAAAGMTTHVGSYHVVAAGSYLADDSTATFAIALENAGLLIIKLPPVGSRGDCSSALQCIMHS